MRKIYKTRDHTSDSYHSNASSVFGPLRLAKVNDDRKSDMILYHGDSCKPSYIHYLYDKSLSVAAYRSIRGTVVHAVDLPEGRLIA